MKNLHLVVLLIVVAILALSLANVVGAQSPTTTPPTPSGEAHHLMPSVVWQTPTLTPRIITTTIGTAYVVISDVPIESSTPIPPPSAAAIPLTGMTFAQLLATGQAVPGPTGPSGPVLPNLECQKPDYVPPREPDIARMNNLARNCVRDVGEIMNSTLAENVLSNPNSGKYFTDMYRRCDYLEEDYLKVMFKALDNACVYSGKINNANSDPSIAVTINFNGNPIELKAKVIMYLTAIRQKHIGIGYAGGSDIQ